MPTVTAKDLVQALESKYPRAAILREVTMDDTEEMERFEAFLALRSPYYRKKFGLKKDEITVELPEGYDPTTAVRYRRIDALMWEGTQRTAIEIKVSRADFFRDTDAKRYAWRKHTHRFIYLTPKGLVTPDEVPAGCGLWEYEGTYITSTKKAVINKDVEDFPLSMMKYFAYRAFSAEKKYRAASDGISVSTRRKPRRRR